MLFQWCWRSPSKHHHFRRMPCLLAIQLMGISRYNDCIVICFMKLDVTKWVFFKTIRSHKWCSRKSSRSYFFTRKISTGSARYCSCGIWWLCRNPVVRNQPKCCSDSNHFTWMVLPPDQILPYNDSIGTSTCHYHLSSSRIYIDSKHHCQSRKKRVSLDIWNYYDFQTFFQQ